MAVIAETSIRSPFHGHSGSTGFFQDRYVLTGLGVGDGIQGYLRADAPTNLTNCSVTLPDIVIPNSSYEVRLDAPAFGRFPDHTINRARVFREVTDPAYDDRYIRIPGSTVAMGNLTVGTTRRLTWGFRVAAEEFWQNLDAYYWSSFSVLPTHYPWFPVVSTIPPPKTIEPYEHYRYQNTYLGDGWDEWEQTVQWAFTSDQTGTIVSDPLPLTFINARITPSFPVSSMGPFGPGGQGRRIPSGDTFESVMRLDVSGDHTLQVTVTPSYGDSDTTGTLLNLVGATDDWEFEWGVGGGASFVEPPGSAPDWDVSHTVIMPPGSWVTWRVTGVGVRPNAVMTAADIDPNRVIPLGMRLRWEVAPITVGGVTQPSTGTAATALDGLMATYMKIGSSVFDTVSDCLIVDDVVMTRERHPL